MGIDVILYADVKVTDEQLAAAEQFVNARTYLGYANDPYLNEERHEKTLVRTEYYGDDLSVEFMNSSRYYGQGYERGDWPAIFGAIMVMGAAFPGAPIYYGGDTGETGDLVTPEFLSDIWAHFLSADGDKYREFWRNWNASQEVAK